MVKKLLALASLICIATTMWAQLPPPCAPGAPPAENCDEACIYCNFNNYSGSTSGYGPGNPPGFCGTIENDQWFGFIAGCTFATFTATPTGCTGSNGVQIALYTDCQQPPIACNQGQSGGAATPVTISTTLTPGVNYFLLIDGYAGDQCNFTISVTPNACVQAPTVGNATVINGPSPVCPGASVVYTTPVIPGAGVYVWDGPPGSLINGQAPPVEVDAPGGNTVTVTFGTAIGAVGNICVQGLNSCNTGNQICRPITVQPIPPTQLPPVTICYEDAPYTLPWGGDVNSSGNYQGTVPSYLGCDSLLRQTVTVKPPLIKQLSPTTLCAGNCMTVCGEEYCDGGSYSYTCESYQGCDSLIQFSLYILDPVAEILGSGNITCTNSSVILNSTISPSGIKIWKNSVGGVIGTGNTVTVTAPGTYTLTVTAQQGGIQCIESDTIVITGNLTPPTSSALGGTLGCGGSSATITASSNVANATYSWTGPGGFASGVQNPTVTVSGPYIVTVTDPANGCTSTATANVTGNTTAPSATANGGTLTCAVTSTMISVTSNASPFSCVWSGPSGYSSTSATNTVTVSGTYTVTVTNPSNNCTNTATAVVNLNNTQPNISATGGTISCITPNVTLNGGSSTASSTFAWVGPGGFSSVLEDPSVNVAGTYTLTVTGPNGCTSTTTADVNGNLLAPNVSAAGGTLTCTVTSLQLAGGSTTPGVSYSWTGPGSFTSNQEDPLIFAPGTYVLTTTGSNGCTSTATADVDQNLATPNASASGGVISCTASSTTITGSSTTPGATYLWSGPGGYSSVNATNSVSTVGTYTLTVYGQNGCTTTATADVLPDANLPNATADGGEITCLVTSVTLQGASTSPGVTFGWTGPGGFTSPLPSPTVTTPGDYTFTVTNPTNGCSSVANAFVVLNTTPPDVTTVGGVLSCAATDLVIYCNTAVDNPVFSWTGPGGFASMVQNPTVTVPGDYTVNVTGENGCSSSELAVVNADVNAPTVSVTNGTLTCTVTQINIVTSVGSSVSYSWAGPGGFTSISQNPTVSVAGNYVVTVLAPNGCTATTTSVISEDIAAPNAGATGDTITCANSSITLTGSSTTTGATYQWAGPSGFNSVAQNPTVGVSGTYDLVVTGPNGCTSLVSTTVAENTTSPTVAAAAAMSLTCTNTTITIDGTATNSSSPVVQYNWTGPNSFASNLEDPSVVDPGNYFLTATSENGCTSQTSVTVNQNITLPTVSAVGGTLTCLVTSIILDGSSQTAGATFNWTGPGGPYPTEDPTINQAGTYTLTVTGLNGCTNETTADVILDGNFPDATINAGPDLDCANTSTTLSGSSTVLGVTYDWSLAGAPISTNSDITVSNPGQYTLVITSPNGCSTVQTHDVNQDITIPDVFADGGTLDCISGLVTLTGNSTTPNVSYNWIGPGGFTSNQPNPSTGTAGLYTLTVQGTNGCTNTMDANVATNSNAPVVNLSPGGTITCTTTSITLSGTIGTPGAVGTWTGPNNFMSSNAMITVTDPGSYVYTVIDPTNGCTSAPSVQVDQNIALPQNPTATTSGTITCTATNVTITGNSSSPNVQYSWTGPGGFTSAVKNPMVSVAGVYTVTITGLNGCQSTASVTVNADVTPPVVNATSPLITCAQSSVVLDATSVPANVAYNWTGPGGFTSTSQDPSVTTPGVYTVKVTANNGCKDTLMVTVDANVTLPGATATGGQLTCQIPSINIVASSGTSGVTYAWTGPGGFTSSVPNPLINVDGTYTVVVTDPVNGCTSTATALVTPDANIPTLSLTDGTVTCAVTSLVLNATSNNPNVTYAWSGPGGFSSTNQNPTVTVSGTYTCVITDPTNGCSKTSTTVVDEDTDGPIVSVPNPDMIDCTTTEVTVQAVIGTPGNYTYVWTTLDGNISGGTNLSSVVATTEGTYSVVVTNADNGCTSTDSGVVDVDSNIPHGAALQRQDISCHGETDGFIFIDSVEGGAPPYLFSIDNQPLTSTAQFTFLSPGAHTIVIQDANGCEYETVQVLEEPEELVVNLGTDTTIHLGQSIELNLGNFVSDFNRVDTFIVTPATINLILCDTCDHTYSPIYTTTYNVTVLDSNGCKATDERTIIVDKTRLVYIPNAIFPESDDTDALFTVYGGEDVEKIESMRIYDRWGENVHEYYNFLPGDLNSAWDGTFKGKKVNPAVFVYAINVLFKDGESKLYTGDLTVIRK